MRGIYSRLAVCIRALAIGVVASVWARGVRGRSRVQPAVASVRAVEVLMAVAGGIGGTSKQNTGRFAQQQANSGRCRWPGAACSCITMGRLESLSCPGGESRADARRFTNRTQRPDLGRANTRNPKGPRDFGSVDRFIAATPHVSTRLSEAKEIPPEHGNAAGRRRHIDLDLARGTATALPSARAAARSLEYLDIRKASNVSDVRLYVAVMVLIR